jgi:hypothetical protein
MEALVEQLLHDARRHDHAGGRVAITRGLGEDQDVRLQVEVLAIEPFSAATKPVWASSTMSSAPISSASARSRAKNSGFGNIMPPAETTVSTMIAATFSTLEPIERIDTSRQRTPHSGYVSVSGQRAQ